MAGLLFQSLYIFLLVLLFGITASRTFYYTISFLNYLLLFNLHPFLRTDGRWVYVDIMDVLEDNPVAQWLNKAYMVFFFLFSVQLLRRGLSLCAQFFHYLTDYQRITLNKELLLHMMYLYLAILLFRGLTYRMGTVWQTMAGTRKPSAPGGTGDVL